MKRGLLLITAPLSLGFAQPAWTLSLRPTLDLGDDSKVETQFNGVSGIVRMPGGEIVVANGLSQELRVFSPAGAYLRTLSATTPAGTMRALGRIWRGGDTIYAAEVLPTESAVWVFTLTGFVARRPVGAVNAGGIYPIDRFQDGRFVISAAQRRPARAVSGMSIDSTPIGILSLSNLAKPTWIGWLRNESVTVAGGGGRGRGVTRERYPYGRSVSYAVSGDRLWIGDSETGTITHHNSAGRGLSILSAPFPPRQLDTALIRRRRATLLSDAMRWEGARNELLYPIPTARLAPRFTQFVPGVNGEMWIEGFHEDPTVPRRFIVVDRAGTAIGRVTLPPRVVIFDIAADALLGVWTDDDGLEHVIRYGLRRP